MKTFQTIIVITLSVLSLVLGGSIEDEQRRRFLRKPVHQDIPEIRYFSSTPQRPKLWDTILRKCKEGKCCPTSLVCCTHTINRGAHENPPWYVKSEGCCFKTGKIWENVQPYVNC